ncbi:type II secretion system protein GspM [Pararhizobium qamdonense]|uniref:type II secretion system protein GspM n=1 Tax=Pararhizobium qamdonense TaxID=3031126 RepID=UPI0023E1B990|nr:type II secretion system protein GspM [Pararhizobium qamdonense]
MIQMAVTSLYSGYTAIDEKRALLGKLKAIATAGVSFEAQLLPENDGNPMLLSGENEAVMSAALQSWLQDVVGTAGGQINSVNNVSETGENGIRMIGLRANLSGSMEVVHRTIASIENNQPRLFIKEVVLNSTNQQISAAENLPAELTATIVFLGASGAPGKPL